MRRGFTTLYLAILAIINLVLDENRSKKIYKVKCIFIKIKSTDKKQVKLCWILLFVID